MHNSRSVTFKYASALKAEGGGRKGSSPAAGALQGMAELPPWPLGSSSPIAEILWLGGSENSTAWMCRERALSDLNLILYVTSVEWKLHSKGKQHHNPISLVLFYCLSRRSHINPQQRHSQGLSSARKSFFAHSWGFISLGSGEQWNTHISGGDGLFWLQPPSPHGSLGDGLSAFPLRTVLPAHLVLSKDAHCCGEDGGSASLLHSDVIH